MEEMLELPTYNFRNGKKQEKRNRNGSHPGFFFYAATDRVMPVRQVKFCEVQQK